MFETQKKKAGKLNVIKILLEKGAAVTGVNLLKIPETKDKKIEYLLLFQKKKKDGTDAALLPVHYAAFEGHLDVVKFFIERNPSDLDAEDALGETCLFKAAENGKLDIVKFLVEKGLPFDFPPFFFTIPNLFCFFFFC